MIRKYPLQDKLPGLGGSVSNPVLKPIKTLGYKHLEKVVKAFDNLPQSVKMMLSLDENFMNEIMKAKEFLSDDDRKFG